MAEITNIRPSFDVSPVVAGLIGASVLVVCVSVTVFVWTCCHQQAEKKHKNPPYKFIHMLKGISIYPETLSNKKKIIKVRRDKDGPGREGGRGNLLVDAAEAGLLGQDKSPKGPSSGSCVDQLPIKVDYGEELRSPIASLTPGESKTTSPSSPEEDVMLGSLTFSVDYNFPKKALVVTIQEAHGLPVMDDQTQGSDPYIKMTILPDKRHRVKTRVLRKTLDPVFDETFTFYGIPYSQLQDLVLHFLVLSFDRFSRDDVIGEVMVPLAGVDPSTGKVQLTRDIIKRNIQKCISRGELQVSLSYQPVAQRMTVVVLKARHLPKMDITGLSGNPYVKVNVYYGRKRIAKKKTHVKKCTLNPVFNESFIYDIPTDLLPDISIEFLVIDFDRTTKNEVVGRLILGAHSVTASGAPSVCRCVSCRACSSCCSRSLSCRESWASCSCSRQRLRCSSGSWRSSASRPRSAARREPSRPCRSTSCSSRSCCSRSCSSRDAAAACSTCCCRHEMSPPQRVPP